MQIKYVALITARGGSKGLPRKNVLPLQGRPLISWTIEAAKQCDFIERVFVSTDDDEIAKISIQYGAEIINRPAELASDTASSIDVVSHAIRWLKRESIECENIVLLQPTSPLRDCYHLNSALQHYDKNKASFVISVFEPAHTPIKSYLQLDNGSIRGLYSDEAPYERRQDLPRAFQPNGAIYAFSVAEFNKNDHFPKANVFPYIMSETDSVDIDTIEDLELVEKILKELKHDKSHI
ncbi:cytidylyltransferase domain-containing protein [Vibrio splendidus]|uniref:acylneuraminate cytidylyltransferase family protein n=1 Tax=Vibrio splendidus TaxID=29497 RepID=UPI000D3B56A3|nr:acylneuraminate cytidylyltransferase family protein [Vibrio splendidus]PTO86006.1 acylneuraminate cytidylyltransferase family protein [Vibrio splendidus]